MHTLTLRIEDNVFDKVMYFLKNLPQKEVVIIADTIEKESKDDFINFMVKNPVKVEKNINFLTRNEANAR